MHVIIVGTSHVFQYGVHPGCSETEATEFRTYLQGLCVEHGVRAISEEMSVDGLAEHCVTTSTCKIVADNMRLQHAYCDPDRAQRFDLEIRDENGVKIEAFMKNRSEEWIAETITRDRRKREVFWLDKLQQLATWPSLFICGSTHVDGFKHVLIDAGLTAIVAAENWGNRPDDD